MSTENPIEHEAIPSIIMAETKPVFRWNRHAVETLLAAAYTTSPETLPAAWVTRLATRFVYVAMVGEEWERMAKWLGVANEHGNQVNDTVSLAMCAIYATRQLVREGKREDARLSLNALSDSVANLNNAKVATAYKVAQAELVLQAGDASKVFDLLLPALRTPETFHNEDDLWTALMLLGQATLVTSHASEAEDYFREALRLCTLENAQEDAADVSAALANVLVIKGNAEEAKSLLKKHRVGGMNPAAEYIRSIVEGTTCMAAEDTESARQAFERAAIQATESNNYHGYIAAVACVTMCYRMLDRHKDMYRNLLIIGGELARKFGKKAAAPIPRMIESLKEDLGEERFETIAGELLVEARQAAGGKS